MDIAHRLRQVIEYKKITPYEISLNTGVSQATLSRILNNSTSKPSSKTINCIAEYLQISKDWLLRGDGAMLNVSGDTVSDSYNTVPLLPVSAQGGSLNDFVTSVKIDECEKITSPVKGIDFAMPVTGDSMAPEYPNGSQILVKKIDEKAFIEWGKVYVLDTCNGSVIKEIHKGDNDNEVKCVSLNPNPKFSPFTVNMSDIYGMYKVVMCMSLK